MLFFLSPSPWGESVSRLCLSCYSLHLHSPLNYLRCLAALNGIYRLMPPGYISLGQISFLTYSLMFPVAYSLTTCYQTNICASSNSLDHHFLYRDAPTLWAGLLLPFPGPLPRALSFLEVRTSHPYAPQTKPHLLWNLRKKWVYDLSSLLTIKLLSNNTQKSMAIVFP